jgi:hypothetical protein
VTKSIATAITTKSTGTVVNRRWGVVSVNNGDGTLNVDLDGTTLNGVHYIANYVPTVGDRVLLDIVGSDVVVTGTLAPSVVPYPAPFFSGICTTALSCPNGFTDITIDTEEYDSHGWHSVVSFPNRYAPVAPGWYNVTAFAIKEAAWTTGNVAVSILKNGSQIHGGENFLTAISVLRMSTTRSVSLNGLGDYVSASFYQDSGSGKNLSVVNGASAGMEVRYLRPNV